MLVMWPVAHQDRINCHLPQSTFINFFKLQCKLLLVTKSISNRGSLKIFLLSRLLTYEVIEDKTFFKIRSEIKGLLFLFVLGFYFPGQSIRGYGIFDNWGGGRGAQTHNTQTPLSLSKMGVPHLQL
jgi:hypothetical protein